MVQVLLDQKNDLSPSCGNIPLHAPVAQWIEPLAWLSRVECSEIGELRVTRNFQLAESDENPVLGKYTANLPDDAVDFLAAIISMVILVSSGAFWINSEIMKACRSIHSPVTSKRLPG
ncbi:MAG: hypothetical protein HQ574_05240 [Chloroflexi bacterium]|nr:hypothetical protein [Chloroflexota bacterium]